MHKYFFILFSILALSSCKANKTEQLNSSNIKVDIEDIAIYGCKNGICNSRAIKFHVTNHTSQTVCFDNSYSSFLILDYLRFTYLDLSDSNYNLMNYHLPMRYIPLQPDNQEAFMEYTRKDSPIMLKGNSSASFYINLQNFYKNETKLTKRDLESFADLGFFVFDCDISKKNYVWQTIESKIRFIQ